MYKQRLHLSLVAAIGEAFELGKDNALLWKIPLDLKFYKNITWGRVTVMGRNTYQSVLNKRGLPPSGRQYVVISRTLAQVADTSTTFIFPSLEEGLDYCIDQLSCDRVIISGGATIYAQSLPFADEMILTHIGHRFEEADTFFPHFEEQQWQLVRSQKIDDKEVADYPLSFNYYQKHPL